MNQDVDQMIAKHRVSPEFVLNPKDRIQEWMVLPGGLRLDPKMRQTAERTELDCIGEIHDVIENGLSIPSWLVGTKGHSNQSRAEKPVPGRMRVGSFATLNCFLSPSIHSHCCSRIDD